MGFEDLVNKAKEALNTDQGEEISDQVLGGAEDLANKATGDKFGDQIGQAKDAADGFLGKSE